MMTKIEGAEAFYPCIAALLPLRHDADVPGNLSEAP